MTHPITYYAQTPRITAFAERFGYHCQHIEDCSKLHIAGVIVIALHYWADGDSQMSLTKVMNADLGDGYPLLPELAEVEAAIALLEGESAKNLQALAIGLLSCAHPNSAA